MPTVEPRVGIRATILVLLFFPTALPAQTNRADEARKLALASEQRGDWLEACRWYDEAYRRDRTRLDCRESYQRCLRQYHLQRRHRDPGYREALSRLPISQALDGYVEVLDRLSTCYVDRSRTDLNALFQEGLREIRFALDDSGFRKEYLTGVPAEAIKAFKKQLDSRPERNLKSYKEAREEVLSVVRAAQQNGLGERPTLLSVVLILEFACGACNALDEYSLFLTPSQHSDAQAVRRGKAVGIGIDLVVVEGRLEISRVYPKSPAEEVGLNPRDRILKIDRQPVEHLPLEWLAERLRGEIASLVELEVQSPGQMPRPVKLVRRPVIAPSVEASILTESADSDTLLGYLRIYSFQDTTLHEVTEALARFQSYGIKGMILDLRGNPGGLFKSSVQVAELFLGAGVIVYSYSQPPLPNYRDPRDQTQFKAWPDWPRSDIANPFTLPLAVLIDSETASSAEVLAGALRDSGRAQLFGQTTFGKGSIQGVIPLRKTPGGIRLTVAQLFSPTTRQPMNGRGVVPHVFVDPESDACLTAARSRLLDQLRMVMR